MAMEQLTLEGLEPPSPLSLLTPDQIFDRADEAMLRSLVEDRRFEKKPNGLSIRDLGDYVCMWANTPPDGGVMAIGIRKDKTFEGLESLGLAYVSDFESAHANYCPDAECVTRRVQIHRDGDGGEDFVLLIRVKYHPARVVKTTSHKAFMRLGDQKKTLDDAHVRQLQTEKGEVRFEREPSRLEYPSDFDTSAMDSFVEGVRDVRELAGHHSREALLEIMHLGKIHGSIFTPNIACDLLFAKDPQLSVPGCKIRLMRFDGKVEGVGAKWNAVKDDVVAGPLPEQILKARDWVRNQLRTFSHLGGNGTFETTLEYPETAWYEAIVNACAHRSYGNGLGNANTVIKMFDDRLSIESPGPFPPFVDPDNIMQSGSVPTNPFLMEALRYLKFVKAAREGTRRIRDTMIEMGLPQPVFSQTETGSKWVHVTLNNDIEHRRVWVDQDVTQILGELEADRLDPDQKRMINYVAEYKKITISQAQRLMNGRTWHYAKKLLMDLKDRGVLEHIHSDTIERDPNAHFVLSAKKGKQ